jgi:hypothetical protein
MNTNDLHIICLKVPFPVKNGADFELFYKIKAISALGVRIHLHCFTKIGIAQQPELDKYCASVAYYQRKKQFSIQFPYIVSSRKSNDLINNLLKDDFPILMDGMHCTHICNDPRFKGRNLLIRAHNVEYLYYKGLLHASTFFLKKWYYAIEMRLLKKYEANLAQRFKIVCLSDYDAKYFKTEYQAQNVSAIPVFFEEHFTATIGIGQFCLYHGSLDVAENEAAVTWLINEVFSKTDIAFVIAGRNPSAALKNLSYSKLNICLAENPTNEELNDLIQKAHINVLPSINATGVKLKLMYALYKGKYCLTNVNGANGFLEKELFLQADTASEMIALIAKYINTSFTQTEIDNRKSILNDKYSNENKAKQLLALFEN